MMLHLAVSSSFSLLVALLAWSCCLPLLLQSSAVGASTSDITTSSPFFVGRVEPLKYASNETVVDSHQAGRMRLPWMMTQVLLDYCETFGIVDVFRDHLLLEDDADDEGDINGYGTEDGGDWNVRHMQVHGGSSSRATSTNLQSIVSTNLVATTSKAQEQEDDASESSLLSVLAFAGLDDILESVGTSNNWEGLDIATLGFVGGTFSTAMPLKNGMAKNNTSTTLVVLPLYLKQGSRPELAVQEVKVKQEMDVAMVLSSGEVTPAIFDYRDSPGELFLAFQLELKENVDGGRHWRKDGSIKLPQPTNVADQEGGTLYMPLAGSNIGSSSNLKKNETTTQAPVCSKTQNNNEDVCQDSHLKEKEEELLEKEDQELEEGEFFWNLTAYDWKLWTFRQFKSYLECSTVFERNDRQAPTEEFWTTVRNAYRDIVGINQSTLPPEEDNIQSFRVNVTAKQSPGRGRGVFAAQDITEGTVVYSPLQQARFADGMLYKRLLMSVPVETACDLMAWVSIQNVTGEPGPRIIIDLDAGALVNTGVRDAADFVEGDDIANVGCLPTLGPTGCMENDFALRDIYVGEELFIDYEEYVVFDGEIWKSFGLGDPSAEAAAEEAEEEEELLEDDEYVDDYDTDSGDASVSQ